MGGANSLFDICIKRFSDALLYAEKIDLPKSIPIFHFLKRFAAEI